MSPVHPDLADAVWFTSSYSGANGSCVEVARLGATGWAVRDSKDRRRSPLVLTAGQWDGFLAGVRRGEFDPPVS
jgi:hypothetical protein